MPVLDKNNSYTRNRYLGSIYLRSTVRLGNAGVLIRYLLVNEDKDKSLNQSNIKLRMYKPSTNFKDRDLNQLEDMFH